MDEDLNTKRQYGSILVKTIYIKQCLCNCRNEHQKTKNFNKVKLNKV